MADTKLPIPKKPSAPGAVQKALHKLGLVRDIDLALHLPLRYEDETRITLLRNARDGDMVQVEATVTASEVQLRPRRQLLVQVDDGTGTCELRFFSFYPSHQKTLAVGARLRIRGEVKGGFWGRQMLHPAFRVAGGELPTALTPVYPTTAGLPQPYLRRAVVMGLQRADLSETLPSDVELPLTSNLGQNTFQRLCSLRDALIFLHHPTPHVSLAALEDRSHPAWQRLKAEELLAQQLSQQQSRRARDQLSAPVIPSGGGAPGTATPARAATGCAALWADGCPAPCGRGNRARFGPHPAHAPVAARRCGIGKNRGVGPGRLPGDRSRLAMRLDGSHGNFG